MLVCVVYSALVVVCLLFFLSLIIPTHLVQHNGGPCFRTWWYHIPGTWYLFSPFFIETSSVVTSHKLELHPNLQRRNYPKLQVVSETEVLVGLFSQYPVVVV